MPETMLPDLIARLDRIADLLERHTPPAGPTVDRLDEAVAAAEQRDQEQREAVESRISADNDAVEEKVGVARQADEMPAGKKPPNPVDCNPEC